MTYTLEALKDKIAEMYPEIGTNNLSIGVEFS